MMHIRSFLLLTLLSFPLAAQEHAALQAADGSLYNGPLINGLREGEGKLTWPNGARYEGSFSGGLISGHGRLWMANGDLYEGGFRDGMMDGKGKLTGKNNDSYEGDFKHSLYHGKGRFQSSNGAVFDGDFADAAFTGQGSIRWPNGNHYVGLSKSWLMQGQGIFTTADGTRYEGAFSDDNLNGFGRIYKADKLYYEGNLSNWQADGQGIMYYANGDRSEGIFSNGDLNGTGHIYRDGKLLYEGSLRNGRPDGQGILHLPNGDHYQGGFQHGLYHGHGILTYAKAQADGRLRDEGNWQYGKADRPEEQQRQRQLTENALYSQRELLNAELARLTPSSLTASEGEMFFLGVAGDGSQEVFRREIDFVREQFEQDFNTKGRAISLVNSRNTLDSRPLATRTSLKESLHGIAQAMNKDRDILFLYLTSHGSAQHELSLNPGGIKVPDLTPVELATYLRDSGIRWKVVVISACYSGGFLEHLKDNGTLVITAARHDRRSFGCSDENDFTYFGRAFFKESLPASNSFQQAFQKASKLVSEWESRDASNEETLPGKKKDAGENFSLPQMQTGKGIEKRLKAWWPHRQS